MTPADPPCTLPRHLLWPGEAHEMAFRRIPPGEFWMGSRGYETNEEPRHRVRITQPFWMAETPVTQAQYAAMGKGNPSHFKDKPDHPVEQVSWLDAVAFADWVANDRAAEMPEGCDLACLPTEAEWEYACRAGTETEYWSGDGEAALAEVGWFGEEWGSGSTHPVRSKMRANPFGLFDMHGNVWEWCHDEFQQTPYRDRPGGAMDTGWDERLADYQEQRALTSDVSSLRSLRGGSWFDAARLCRSAFRGRLGAARRLGDFGFRLCLLPGPKEQAGSGAQGGRRGGGTEPKPTEQGGAGVVNLRAERGPRPRPSA
ncbi:MAG: formylglycine-generating enzyme family protein [Verrucomicrobiales bacterium]|nr:formylglycine-generating enzyme family protein [Verrucomicrobiales bacterium]